MITLAVANQIIEAAIKKAKEIKQPMCIAVVDEGGNMVQHVRMDGGCLGSVDIRPRESRCIPLSDRCRCAPGR
jgi:uncharacterized protein GlcG (DUF336 family)